MRHDQVSYINRARESLREEEALLRAELAERDAAQDAAWDTTGRRAE